MSLPLVSVAMATYNGAKYLRDQLETIVSQSYPNIEIVVSDDASDDGTANILNEYTGRRGLRYAVNATRLGMVKNFEQAMRLCRGEYVALCDQDDLWKAHKVETFVANIEGASLIYCCSQEYLDSSGKKRPIGLASQRVMEFALAAGTGRPTRYVLAENWVASHSVLFHRDVMRLALPIPEHQPFHDAWLVLVASKLGGIRYLGEALQVYREHPSSLTYGGGARNRVRSVSIWSGLRNGHVQSAWRQLCQAESLRLQAIRRLPQLDEGDQDFISQLLTYYRAGLEPGWRWQAFLASWRILPYFYSLRGRRRRWLFPLRPLVAGRAKGHSVS